MPNTTEQLLRFLNTEQLNTYSFVSHATETGMQQVFGGQILAQSLNCAIKTVPEDRYMHSMHAYFLRPGDIHKSIIYDVSPIRDGGSFTTRRVVAKQDSKEIYSTTISFCLKEEGLEHSIAMPKVASPCELQCDNERLDQLKATYPKMRMPSKINNFNAIETRTYGISILEAQKDSKAVQGFWFKTREPVFSEDVYPHQALLTYISDMRLISTSFFPHGIPFNHPNVQVASIDHSLWIHRHFKADEWIYYDMNSSNASAGKGLNFGRFFDLKGNLIASSAQEGLMRIRSAE